MADEVELILDDDSPYSSGFINMYDDGTMRLLRDADEEYIPDKKDQKSVIREGDTLQNLAGKYYNDSCLWHILARANEDLDILHPQVGQTIIIPNPENYR